MIKLHANSVPEKESSKNRFITLDVHSDKGLSSRRLSINLVAYYVTDSLTGRLALPAISPLLWIDLDFLYGFAT